MDWEDERGVARKTVVCISSLLRLSMALDGATCLTSRHIALIVALAAQRSLLHLDAQGIPLSNQASERTVYGRKHTCTMCRPVSVDWVALCRR